MATPQMKAQNGTTATMRNQTPMTMKLDRFINWSGTPSGGAYPNFIAANSASRFNHLKGNQFGSKGAVQYSGPNANGVDCAWIMAWDAPADMSDITPNRVYSVCGAKSIINAITWDQVLDSLDIALTAVKDSDAVSKTFTDCTIHAQAPNIATLIASFGLSTA